jgi:nicotinate-nucleotide--dimethylbenzimidazole phosphoribosyltransferase
VEVDEESSACRRAIATISSPDPVAAADASAHHLRLTKPAGSLGLLETVGVRLAGIAGASPPPVPSPATVAVFAADHGVLAEGVTPWPQDVTAQMVANFCSGGAAINVLARHASARVLVVDVGVATTLDPAPGLLLRKVRAGTANLAIEPAMSLAEARRALDVGAEVAAMAVTDGARCLVTGEMGIGNTTASAALIAACTARSAQEVTGRGTGIDDATLARKTTVVDQALLRLKAEGDTDPIATMASIGGLEIAALAGFIIGGAAARVPVIVDGVIALAGLLTATQLAPESLSYCFAGHRSTEPGASIALEHLGMEPLLDLGMRLGEGSGACLALSVVEAAAKIVREMATFDAAGVTDKTDGRP